MTWIATRSGGKLDFLNPRPEQIHIEDIATSLSRLPRFAGHTTDFYGVAQHSVHCSRLCEEYPLEALLHDATEAYMGDCNRPLKQMLGEAWTSVENRIQDAINLKFQLRLCDSPVHRAVKEVDDRMLMTERKWMMPRGPEWEGCWPEPYDVILRSYSPEYARDLFMSRYRDLTS